MKTLAFFLAFLAMPLMAQITPAPTAKPSPSQAPAPKRPQTAILGMSGGLFVFNDKHEIVGHCERITGKVVEGCSIEKGHTVTELVQGMITTLVP